VKHGFDSRLLHKAIAFPLLNKLAKLQNLQTENITIQEESKIHAKKSNNYQSRYNNIMPTKVRLLNSSPLNLNYKNSNERKIYTPNNELFAIMTLTDIDTIQIKITNPFKYKIQETSDDYLQIFLKEALIKIKELNPHLSVNYTFVRNTPFIENITISHIHKSTHLDLISEKFGELIA